MSLFITIAIIFLICSATPADDAPHQEALAQIVRVNYASASQLDSLAAVIHPGEVNVEGGLNNAEDDANRVEEMLCGTSNNPIEDIECTVPAKCYEIVTVDDGRYGRLAQKQKLRQDAHAFEDDAEGPQGLRD
jgi:hypothetical protein